MLLSAKWRCGIGTGRDRHVQKRERSAFPIWAHCPWSSRSARTDGACMRNLNHLFSGQSHSAGPGELSIRFFLDENSSDARANVGGVAVGTRAKDSLWRHLLELRASGVVGLRWQAVFGCQIIWNRSTRRAGAHGGARVGRPKWLRILTITVTFSTWIIMPHISR